MSILRPNHLHLVALQPITSDDGALSDVVASFAIDYVDESGVVTFTETKTLSTFQLMAPEQLAVVQALYQSIFDGLKQQNGIA